MAFFGFYEPEFNPTGLSGEVGGSFTSTVLKPKLGELVSPMESSVDSEVTQYRKLFIRQDEEATFQDLSVILSNVEHTGQVSFAISTGQMEEQATDAITAPDGIPSDNFSGDHVTAITLTGTSVQDDIYGIWLRVVLPTGAGIDELATFGVRVKGTRLN